MKEFKLIVSGGRDFINTATMENHLLSLILETYKNYNVSILSGMARGADSIAVTLAQKHQLNLYKFPADWKVLGKSAGFQRNQHMADAADGLLAFWDGSSKGTGHMINCMKLSNKPIHIVHY